MDTTEWTAHTGNGKRAVVPGGAGFLGSHLCAKLLDHGFSVTAIDNLSTGNTRNLAALHDRGNFIFRKHDVVQPTGIQADWIFNLACCASPQHYQRDPERTVRTRSFCYGAGHQRASAPDIRGR